MDGYRGVYNSAWVGGAVTIFTVVFMAFAGFYLVKNTITRDCRTVVGQIIATSPLSNVLYIFGKMLSNFTYLAIMALVAAIGMQVIRGEVVQIDVAAYFLILGTICSFPFVTFLADLPQFDPQSSISDLYLDPTGMLTIVRSMVIAGVEEGILGRGGITLGFTYPSAYGLEPGTTYLYQGVSWSNPVLIPRLIWNVLALGLTLVSAFLFDRFDSSQESVKVERETRTRKVKRKGDLEASKPILAPPQSLESIRLSPIPETRPVSQVTLFGRTMLSELHLLAKGLPCWWYAVAGGLILGGLVSPTDQGREIWLPLAWVWPVLVWSSLGIREQRHRTTQMVFSAPYPISRQLPASWTAGFLISIATGSGVIVRLLRAGEWQALLGLVVGAAFIPSMALALGTWSGTSKLFEVVYLLLWYVGPMSATPELDYLTVRDQTLAQGSPLVFLVATGFKLGIAFLGRRRQFER
jgi:hypothetical protein